MNGDKVGGAINPISVGDQFHAELFGPGFGQKGIVGKDFHSKRQGAFGDFATDSAHAENAQGFSV